jgi:hypothetical protein
VDVVFQRATVMAEVGTIVKVPVAVFGNGQRFSVCDIVLAWDAERLRHNPTLEVLPWAQRWKVENTGVYDWLLGGPGFLEDSNGDAWNDDVFDGDAWYTAWANFTTFPVAIARGCLVAEFEFEILRPGMTWITFVDGPGEAGARPQFWLERGRSSLSRKSTTTRSAACPSCESIVMRLG